MGFRDEEDDEQFYRVDEDEDRGTLMVSNLQGEIEKEDDDEGKDDGELGGRVEGMMRIG